MPKNKNMKLPIPRKADVQTAFRLPKEDWDKVVALAEENQCEKSDILRYIVNKFFND